MKSEKRSPLIGICIINYHQPALTLNCLDSLAKQTFKHFKVFLIDNDTKGEFTKKQLDKFSFLHYHNELTNTGFCLGNNLAIKQALNFGCDYIILLNNDTVVLPNFLETFIAHSIQQTSTDILGCNIVYLKQPKIVWFAGGILYQPLLITRHLLINQSIQKTKHLPPIRLTDWLSGCVMGMKAEFFKKVGFFDETFFAYLEDVDLCLRAKNRGGKCIIINQSLVHHAVSPSTGNQGSNLFSDIKLKLQSKNSTILIKKHSRYPSLFIPLNFLAQASIYLIQNRITVKQLPIWIKTYIDYIKRP